MTNPLFKTFWMRTSISSSISAFGNIGQLCHDLTYPIPPQDTIAASNQIRSSQAGPNQHLDTAERVHRTNLLLIESKLDHQNPQLPRPKKLKISSRPRYWYPCCICPTANYPFIDIDATIAYLIQMQGLLQYASLSVELSCIIALHVNIVCRHTAARLEKVIQRLSLKFTATWLAFSKKPRLS